MTERAFASSKVTRFACAAAGKVRILAGVAVALSVASVRAPDLVVKKMIFSAASTLALFCVVVLIICHVQKRVRQIAFSTLSDFISRDVVASVLTDADGVILSCNKTAQRRFSAQKGHTITGTLDKTVANPAAIIYRLKTEADAQGASHETIVTGKGHLRVSVLRSGEDGYLWRVEDIQTAPPAAEGPTVPMIIVGRSNAILHMNQAARLLLGGKTKSLDRIFSQLPVIPGAVCDVTGTEGTSRALICEMDAGAGRRALFFMPPQQQDGTSSDQWNAFQNLPVPLLKVAPDGTVQAFNRMAVSLIGAPLTETAQLSDLMEGLGRSISDWLSDALVGRTTQSSEFLRLKRSDKEAFVQVTLNRVSEKGGAFAHCGAQRCN